MNKITPAQLRKIHALARECGIDGDTLHAHVYTVAKKNSVKALSVAEAVKVIDSLEGKERAASDRMTGRQRAFIFGLMKEIGWTDDDGRPDEARLMGFIREKFHVERMNWVTSKTASNVIEALKAMKNRMSEVE